MTTASKAGRPDWWNREQDSAWRRVKAAFRWDWEQTKHDFGANVPDFDQNVGDTLSQATGSRSIPHAYEPNFEEKEPAFRYGYGARAYYGDKYPEWNDELDQQLRENWHEDWPTSREAVRRGWEYSQHGDRGNPPPM